MARSLLLGYWDIKGLVIRDNIKGGNNSAEQKLVKGFIDHIFKMKPTLPHCLHMGCQHCVQLVRND